MANATLQMAIGQDVVCVITPQTRAADGTFADHTVGALSFNGRLEQLENGIEYTDENLSPIGVFNANPVSHEMSGTYRISEFVQAVGIVTQASKGFGKGNVLQRCIRTSIYHKLVIQLWDHGTPTQVDELVAYVKLNATGRTTTKGRVMDNATLQLVPLIDSATGNALPNPAFGGTY